MVQEVTTKKYRTLAREALGELKTAVHRAESLRDFLIRSRGALELEDDQIRVLLQQARILFERFYVHLPVKQALHGVDPVRRLERLERRLESTIRELEEASKRNQPHEPQPGHLDILCELIGIFKSARDRHMRFELPAPFSEHWAYLGFEVEAFYEAPAQGAQRTAESSGPLVRKYLVSHVMRGQRWWPFGKKVEIVSWNGVPIERAIEIHAERESGGNPAARRARGLARLTLRPLGLSQPPDEEEVTVGYVDTKGQSRTKQFTWEVIREEPEPDVTGSESAWQIMALDHEGDAVRRMRKLLFKPEVLAQERAILAADELPPAAALSFDVEQLDTRLPKVFLAGKIPHADGPFGYVRVFTFRTGDQAPVDFVDEFVDLVRRLPQKGLVIDVRDNPGGIVQNAERLLQVLTPRRIEPEPFQFRATPDTLKLTQRNVVNTLDWHEPVRRALEQGSQFSRGLAVTEKRDLDRLTQAYRGPIVLVVNANSYSATDIFAAGFDDHQIGVILGTDANTGAGGADVWDHQRLLDSPTSSDGPSPLEPLPSGRILMPLRRSVRVEAQAGAILEDAGVAVSERHFMTRDDLLHKNASLRERAAEILVRMARRDLRDFTIDSALETKTRDGRVRLKVMFGSVRIGFVNVLVNDRALPTVEVKDGLARIELRPIEQIRTLELRAVGHNGSLLAVRQYVGQELDELIGEDGEHPS